MKFVLLFVAALSAAKLAKCGTGGRANDEMLPANEDLDGTQQPNVPADKSLSGTEPPFKQQEHSENSSAAAEALEEQMKQTESVPGDRTQALSGPQTNILPDAEKIEKKAKESEISEQKFAKVKSFAEPPHETEHTAINAASLKEDAFVATESVDRPPKSEEEFYSFKSSKQKQFEEDAKGNLRSLSIEDNSNHENIPAGESRHEHPASTPDGNHEKSHSIIEVRSENSFTQKLQPRIAVQQDLPIIEPVFNRTEVRPSLSHSQEPEMQREKSREALISHVKTEEKSINNFEIKKENEEWVLSDQNSGIKLQAAEIFKKNDELDDWILPEEIYGLAVHQESKELNGSVEDLQTIKNLIRNLKHEKFQNEYKIAITGFELSDLFMKRNTIEQNIKVNFKLDDGSLLADTMELTDWISQLIDFGHGSKFHAEDLAQFQYSLKHTEDKLINQLVADEAESQKILQLKEQDVNFIEPAFTTEVIEWARNKILQFETFHEFFKYSYDLLCMLNEGTGLITYGKKKGYEVLTTYDNLQEYINSLTQLKKTCEDYENNPGILFYLFKQKYQLFASKTVDLYSELKNGLLPTPGAVTAE